jgi:ATP-binding cassette subfamily B protein
MTLEEFDKGWTGTCLLFSPGADRVQVAATRSPWARFASYLAPYKNIIGHLILATLIIEILGVAPPIIVQNILDRVVVHHSVQLLHVLIVGLILSHVFTQLTTVLRGFLSNYLTRSLDFTMISQFFMHTLSLPMSFFNKRRTGDIFARFQENLTVRNFMTESTISTILNVLMTFIYFIVLFMYNVKMTLLLIAFVIPLCLLTLAITPKIKDYARRAFETSTDAEAVLMETISGAETVKAMGLERPMRMRWEKKYAKSLDVQYRSRRFDILMGLVGQLLNSTTTVVILWVGANMVLSNELTIGQLIAFNMLMGSVMSPLMGLIGLWDELQETGVSMERLGDVLDIEPEQKPADIESRILLPELDGHIRFEDVFFRYGGKETPLVLENISLEITPGELVAIVGPSGSGKTTLAKLVVGFYPPTEGKIYVDGYDLKVVDKEYFRRQVGYVMQNNLLFSGTIVDNIAAGDENPDKRRVVKVAKLADAHGFISAMPLGYEQIVGERGVGLSGGQMQRLCIARALYHNPRILVLDEATSALDTQSESNILKNMQGVLEGRTAIVIAHRLSTIMNADKILVLYNGSIVEEGRHQELVDREGMYYQLVQRQMTGMQ